jgi:hypothetical protein
MKGKYASGIRCIEGWVSRRDTLDPLEDRKITFFLPESEPKFFGIGRQKPGHYQA